MLKMVVGFMVMQLVIITNNYNCRIGGSSLYGKKY